MSGGTWESKAEVWSDSASPQKEKEGTHTDGMSGTGKGLRASLCHKEAFSLSTEMQENTWARLRESRASHQT